MLKEFLKTIRDGEVQSLLDIARILHITQDMALEMANDLTRKGYLQEMGAECDSGHTPCSDCPAGSSCQVMTRNWFLTDKGKSIVSESSR